MSPQLNELLHASESVCLGCIHEWGISIWAPCINVCDKRFDDQTLVALACQMNRHTTLHVCFVLSAHVEQKPCYLIVSTHGCKVQGRHALVDCLMNVMATADEVLERVYTAKEASAMERGMNRMM